MSSTNSPRPNRTPIFVAVGCCALLAVVALVAAIIGGVVLLNRGDDPEPTGGPSTSAQGEPTSAEGEPTEEGTTPEGTSEAAPPSGQASAPVELATEGGTVTATFGPVDWDANAEVAEANQFNEPPPSGQTYILVPVSLTYAGSGEFDPYIDTTITYIGPDGAEYEIAPAVVDKDFVLLEAIPDGGTAEGNMAFLVPEGTTGGEISISTTDPAAAQKAPLS